MHVKVAGLPLPSNPSVMIGFLQELDEGYKNCGHLIQNRGMEYAVAYYLCKLEWMKARGTDMDNGPFHIAYWRGYGFRFRDEGHPVTLV